MMNRGIAIGIIVVALAAGVALFWRRQTVPPAPAPPTAAERAPEARPVTVPSPGRAVSDQRAPVEEDGNAVEPPREAVAPVTAAPLSAVPHRVLKAWGGKAKTQGRGSFGLTVIVDPSITDAELKSLSRDILSKYGDAQILSARIFDAEAAARYDIDSDGGALYNKHLVGHILVNENFGKRKVRIRGEWVDPDIVAGMVTGGKATDGQAGDAGGTQEGMTPRKGE